MGLYKLKTDLAVYLKIGEHQTGPFSEDQILGLYQDGEILSEHLVTLDPQQTNYISVAEFIKNLETRELEFQPPHRPTSHQPPSLKVVPFPTPENPPVDLPINEAAESQESPEQSEDQLFTSLQIVRERRLHQADHPTPQAEPSSPSVSFRLLSKQGGLLLFSLGVLCTVGYKFLSLSLQKSQSSKSPHLSSVDPSGSTSTSSAGQPLSPTSSSEGATAQAAAKPLPKLQNKATPQTSEKDGEDDSRAPNDNNAEYGNYSDYDQNPGLNAPAADWSALMKQQNLDHPAPSATKRAPVRGVISELAKEQGITLDSNDSDDGNEAEDTDPSQQTQVFPANPPNSEAAQY